MATTRSAVWDNPWLRYANQGATRSMPLDPELVNSLAFLGDMGLTMEVFSGGQPESGPDRVGSHRHDLGRATDVFFYDQTGRKLDWSNPEDQKIFTQIVQQAKKAGLTGFGAGEGYMQPGSMHLGYGTPGIWGAEGKGENAAPWLQAAYEMKAQGYSDEQIKAAFLSTIAGTEAPGYDVLYGGGTFSDYSQHPNQAIPITSGPNKGKTSSAAGRYQFIYDTWADQQKKLGLTDFSAASQDAAAWNLAQETYRKATGGDLMEALQSNDPARINAASQILSSQWTSLPGGIEMAGKYGDQTFADVYNQNLGTTTPPETAEEPAVASSSPYKIQDDKSKDKWAEAIGEGVSGFGEMKAPVMGQGGKAPQMPKTAPMPMPAMPMVAPTPMDQVNRDLFAAILQKYRIV